MSTSKNLHVLFCTFQFKSTLMNRKVVILFIFRAQFIEDIQSVMGIPEWMLTVDSRKTKLLHKHACIQFLLHFKGPIANRLEQDFNRLISFGTLETPTLYIPGYINTKRKSKISYRQCGASDPNEKGLYCENVCFEIYF